MYMQGIVVKLKSVLTKFDAHFNTLPQCLKIRSNHKSAKMSKLISINPNRCAFKAPVNKKQKMINDMLSRGEIPATDYMRLWALKTGAYGGTKSLLLETSHQHYLFNCGEGIQRAINTIKKKAGRLDDIFLTHKSWSNIGGLYGLLLTRAGANREGATLNVLNLHGPPGVEQILQMAKQFQDTQEMLGDVEKYEITNRTYNNYQVDVEYVKISSTLEETKTIAENESAEIVQNSSNTDTNFSVAYIVKPKKSKWKLDKMKLAELSVKSRGPWLTELVNGNPHTLEDGRVITREEICIPPPYVPPIVILECPGEGYLKSLLSSDRLQQLADSGDEAPQLIVHMTPGCIIDRDDYQEFMKRFKTAHHVILNERSKDSVPHTTVAFQQGLNNLHPDIFPNLYGCKAEREDGEREYSRIVQAEAELIYNLKPYTKFGEPGFDWSNCFALDPELSIRTSFKDARIGARETVEAWKEQLKNTPAPENRREYPEVVFLGTASSLPGTHRNVSGILLHLSHDKCMLLDCGESTTEQIRTVYGERADDVFSKLAAIFVSHLHADHHMGLFGVINARAEALERLGKPMTRLPILAPILLQRWLFLYFRTVKNLFNEIQLIRHVPDPQSTPALAAVHRSILDALDLQEFAAIPVNHVPHAYGVSMTHRSGWKLCFSGDTTPCQRLVEGGKGCDLLIHEATFSEYLEQEALNKNHSTIAQAIKIGQDMKAKFIMLTHFSQRYPVTPLLPENLPDNVGIAFDYMKVTLDDLSTVAKLIPVLGEMFENKLEQYKYRDTYSRDRFSKTGKRKVDRGGIDYAAVLEEIEAFNSKKRNKDGKKHTEDGTGGKHLGKQEREISQTDGFSENTAVKQTEDDTHGKHVGKHERKTSQTDVFSENTAVKAGKQMNENLGNKKNIFETRVADSNERSEETIDTEETENDMKDLDNCSNEYNEQTYIHLQSMLFGDDVNSKKDADNEMDSKTGEKNKSVVTPEVELSVETKDDIEMNQEPGCSIDISDNGVYDKSDADIDSLPEVKIKLKE